jgi:protein LTV1
MQHLRGIGESSGSGAVLDSVMLPAPGKGSHGAARGGAKGKGRARDDDLDDDEKDDFFGIGKKATLPSSVLPSGAELTREQAYEAQAAVPRDIAGFQPDMDPHLRQVLEALEDDAFVADEEEVDFMDDLLAEGERDDEEDFENWEFREWGADEDAEEGAAPQDDLADEAEEGDASAEPSWEDRFKAFKSSGKLEEVRKQAAEFTPSEAEEGHSEMADTVASLPAAMKVIGGKKRRKGASDASGYSMSSSSMFRNKGLSTLDEMFDQKVSSLISFTPTPSPNSSLQSTKKNMLKTTKTSETTTSKVPNSCPRATLMILPRTLLSPAKCDPNSWRARVGIPKL